MFERQYSTIKENMTGDFTMSFNYMGTIADGGTLTITKTGNTISAKLVSGNFVKEGLQTV